MRVRCLSPDNFSTLDSLQHKQQPKLRWVGSQTKLASPSELEDHNECRVGAYTYFRNREVGAGYSSKVYKARKEGTNAEYAVKVVDLRKFNGSNLDMLDNQIQILKTLSHPNVLKCYDVFRNESQCFIVTEYCPHGDLLTQLAKKGRFTEKQALEIMADVMAGYKYLCRQSVIHRDLKPANILKSGKQWKIADFGFAIKSQLEIRTKYNVGTPLYMPPEALIDNTYSAKSDIFSIGVILYELLVGCTPWESRTEKDLLRKMGSLPFRIPDKYSISPRVKHLLQKMCEVKLRRRMGKQEFIQLDLQRLADPVDNPEEQLFQSQKCTESQFFSSRVSHRSNDGLPSLMRLVSSQTIALEPKQDLNQKRQQSFYNQLLMCQLHFCRFMYYLVRNCSSVLLDRKQGQKLGLVVFTHMLKLVKLIADPNVNYLRLAGWPGFKKSKKYLSTFMTIKQYSLRYEKQYLAYLKVVDLAVLQQVNEMFPADSAGSLTIDFYNKICRFLVPLLRSFNHNLGSRLLKSEGAVGRDESGHIEALKALLNYHHLLGISVQHFEDFEYFEANCRIKVNVDFRKTGADLQVYQQLRKQLKNI